MREYITGDTIANQIRMIRIQYSGSFLIIEGYTDARLYKRFVESDKCQIIVAHNKENAIKALSLLDADNFSGAVAIVDTDFDMLEGKLYATQNLLLTDTHDFETMIIKSPAFDKVLTEFGSEDKITIFVRKYGKDIPTVLIECGIPIGYLRWVSLRDGLSLKFEDLDFGKFINKENLIIEASRLIKTVKDKSQRHDITEDYIKNRMEQFQSDTHDPWHVCCGHDLVCILSLGLCKAIGSYNTNDVKPDIIERSLRLAFERFHFSKTQLYLSIQNWEKTNPPFVILNAET
jgi:hypothetical protein